LVGSLRREFITFILFVIFLSILSVNAYATPISATTNKISFLQGETLTITGSLSGTNSVKNISLTIYNSTSGILNSSTVSSTGSTINIFSITNTVNGSYNPGTYTASLTDGTDATNLTFKVIGEFIIYEGNTINKLGDVINVSTSTIIQTGNETFGGGNFTDLLNLSKSSPQKLHYGNYTIGGKVYHFVLVDQSNSSVFDRLYIDDDTNFRLFNDTEDTGTVADVEYQALKEGSKFSNSSFTYLVGEIDSATGNVVILWVPSGKVAYGTTGSINITVITKNSTHLQINEPVKIDVFNSTGQNVTPTSVVSTNEFGWLNTSITLTNVPVGLYTISFNDSASIMVVPVEAFKLFVAVSDDSNNYNSVFAPDSIVRIWVTAKTETATLNLTTLSTTIYFPNGSSITKSKSDYIQTADGVYYYDTNLKGSPTGSYSVSVTGSDGTNTQTVSTGFSLQSIQLFSMAVNMNYIEKTGGVFGDSFPPNTNVTIFTALLNASSTEEFENSLIKPADCNTTISLVNLVDENDVSYSVPYRGMNVSDTLNYLSITFPDYVAPPPEFLSQCMLIFPNTNLKNGIYRAELKVKHNGEEILSGLTFSIQRLFAYGKTVDFRGDSYGFFAPNTTVRMKIVVIDLLTDQELPAANITSGKIIEMHKEWPEFKDVLGNTSLRNTLNESITNGTISFLAPNEEGFYSARFRFTAVVGNSTETGIGDMWFELKKYMIWGQLTGAQRGQWFVKQGQNITLEVTVIDIDKAQTAFGYGSETRTCTGCTGLIINVSELRNNQQFKTVTNYTVLTGTIVNSTNPIANVTIIPGSDMQTGWYSADLLARDPATNATYFGWSWFEIRNFWVETRETNFINSTHSSLGGWGTTYPVGAIINFTVVAREPGTGNILTPTSTALENIQFFSKGGWAVALTGFTSTITDKTIVQCEQVCQTFSGKEISISGLPTDKEGFFEANVRVTVGSVSDIGTYFFETSSYQVDTTYRQNAFPPLFASTENFTINFTALDFNKKPVNITNVTIEDFWSQKLQRPIRMKYGTNYTTKCGITSEWNVCTVNISLDKLGTGEFFVSFKIVNNQSVAKLVSANFKVQDLVVSLPSIETWRTWRQDSASKKVEDGIWRGEWTSCSQDKGSTSGFLKFCGSFWTAEKSTDVNITALNVSSTKELFGYIPLMDDWAAGEFGKVANKSRMYMFSNGTHLWINASTSNLTQTTPVAVGGTFKDNQGGIWRLDKIGDRDITIFGLNSLYSTGVLINTSLSKSGIYKLSNMHEENLGAFTTKKGGVDLNGDGYTNGTVYFVTSDNATSGVYDTFFFSKDGNFTGNASNTLSNPISINDLNRSNREIGYSNDANQKLTVLGVDARREAVVFYSRQVGDWADLGEIKLNNNITIPVIVASPDGTPKSVNVSINAYRNYATGEIVQTNLVSNVNVTGVGELRFNSSLVGGGEFSFGIKGEDTLEEWKWPRAFIRAFLVDGSVGEGIYLANEFKPLPLAEWNWNTYGKIPRVTQDRSNSSFIVNGVLAGAGVIATGGCQVWSGSTNATDAVINNEATYGILMLDGPSDSYFFYNSTENRLYRNLTGCFFNVSVAESFLNGSTIIIDANNNEWGRTYNLSIYVDRNIVGCSDRCWRTAFYVKGISNSTILPIIATTSEWAYMQNISIGGTFYDVVLANDTNYNYQYCTLQNISDCVRKAWFVQRNDGDFSNAVGVTIGQNFTQQLYLAFVGPLYYDGVIAGNRSQLPALNGSFSGPGLAYYPADNTTSYFAVLNETSLAIDLDKNSTLNATFYMFAVDHWFDGLQNLTTAIVDDDLQIMDLGIGDKNGSTRQIDFTSDEIFTGINASWTAEQWSSLPSESWSGYARFGDDYTTREWEQQPTWNIPFYNKTHMILQKDVWRIQPNTTVSAYLTVFNFDKTKISDANVSVKQMARSTYFGYEVLSAANYSVNTTYNKTDANGIAFLRISPNPTTTRQWADGQYQVLLNAQGPGGNETLERWFCVRVCDIAVAVATPTPAASPTPTPTPA